MFGTRTTISLDTDDWEEHLLHHIQRGTLLPSEEDEKVSLEFNCFRIIFLEDFTYKSSNWKNINFKFRIFKNSLHFDMRKYLNNYAPKWSKNILFNYCPSMNLKNFISMIKDLKKLEKLNSFK